MVVKRPTRRLFQHVRFKLKKDRTRIMAKKRKSKNQGGIPWGEKLNLIISNEIHGPACSKLLNLLLLFYCQIFKYLK